MKPSEREFQDRVQREVAKAVEKYGEIALNPSGHPDYDVYDYLLNEIVGLVRYAEMIEHRTKELTEDERLIAETNWISDEISDLAYRIGPTLIDLRQLLIEKVGTLGKTEQR